MTELLTMPYFVQDEASIQYLGQYPYLDTRGLEVDSAIGQRVLLSEGIKVKMPEIPVDIVNKTGDRIVVLEPHPDDLALSASGYIMDAIASGGVCKVINLFSRTSLDRFAWKDKVSITEEEFEDLRMQESLLAVEDFLGQEFMSLRLPLASKRGYEDIFAESHRDRRLVQSVGESLARTILEQEANIVLCPLGVQGHIDHLVTFDIGRYIKSALGDQIDLILYEDYPYSRNKVAYFNRLRRVADIHRLGQDYVATDSHLGSMADMAIIYKSQFDDTNRDQMHALMREDCRATALELRAGGIAVEAECAQRFWRVYED